jgi:hypothetical protein
MGLAEFAYPTPPQLMQNWNMAGEGLRRIQERYRDPLLTALTLMLAILLFVVGPLQAAGDVGAHHFGIAFALVLSAAVFIVSRSVVAVGALSLAITLIISAGVLRSRHPSDVDIYLDATAWMIFGVTLGVVVARGRICTGAPFHRASRGWLLLVAGGSLLKNGQFWTDSATISAAGLHPQRGLARGIMEPKNNKHKDYTRYAMHCLNVVPAINDQDDRAINREMAAEWLRLADAVLHPLKRMT